MTRMKTLSPAIVSLSLAALFAAGESHAVDDCSPSQRVEPPSCVTEDFEGKSAWATNNCPEFIVLKVDRSRGGNDWEWELDANGGNKEDSGGYPVRDILCCDLLSDCTPESLSASAPSECHSMKEEIDAYETEGPWGQTMAKIKLTKFEERGCHLFQTTYNP